MAVIRKAVPADIPAVAEIYRAILDEEEAGRRTVGWVRGIYPTEATARTALEKGTLFVLEDGGQVWAAAKIDGEQVPEYRLCPWTWPAEEGQVLVLHTLVVHPLRGGRGYGRQLVAFYEDCARSAGRPFLRMDTNVRNTVARRLYAGLGYREAGVVSCCFNGIAGVELVCLEKKIMDR